MDIKWGDSAICTPGPPPTTGTINPTECTAKRVSFDGGTTFYNESPCAKAPSNFTDPSGKPYAWCVQQLIYTNHSTANGDMTSLEEIWKGFGDPRFN
jgi:hypothetical protein